MKPRNGRDMFANRMHEVLEHCKGRAAANRATMEYYANAHRRPALRFRAGDWVLVHVKNRNNEVEGRKLASPWIGPYRILEQVAPLNYRVELPKSVHKAFHPIFHTDKLKLVPRDPFPSQPTQRHQIFLGPVEVWTKCTTVGEENSKTGLVVLHTNWGMVRTQSRIAYPGPYQNTLHSTRCLGHLSLRSYRGWRGSSSTLCQ